MREEPTVEMYEAAWSVEIPGGDGYPIHLTTGEIRSLWFAMLDAKEAKPKQCDHAWRYMTDDKTYKCQCGEVRSDFPYGPATFKD